MCIGEAVSLANIAVHYILQPIADVLNEAELFRRFIDDIIWISFVEQPSCHSLDICENKWYHLLDTQINIQNMILPHVK